MNCESVAGAKAQGRAPAKRDCRAKSIGAQLGHAALSPSHTSMTAWVRHRAEPVAPRQVFKATITGLLALMVSGFVRDAVAADAPPNVLRLTARLRGDDATRPDERVIDEKVLEWDAHKTAIIICDMWNEHWCRGASRRVAEMAPRMNDVLDAARSAGVFIIHAPSDCMKFYHDHPGRQIARNAPSAANAPEGIDTGCSRLTDEPALPIDDSDGGCDCQPQCRQGSPWTRQIDTLEIAACDAISDSGREIWNLLEARGIDNVVLMGVHTNMCVVGRPFGLRQLARAGKNVVLARDLTDSMYNSRMRPQVVHRRGTELVIAHIESYVCPTILSADLLGEPARPRILFVIGEDEYETDVTLPRFAREELESRGLECRFVLASKSAPNDFPGVEALAESDLLVLSVRRRAPRAQQLAAIRGYLESSKPLVAIRTASHAFELRDGAATPAEHDTWPAFDTEILGGDYLGHYGNKPPSGPATIVEPVATAAGHPVLAGIPLSSLRVTSHLYKNRDLAKSTTTLLVGSIDGQPEREPAAWTNNYRGARVFYISLGNPADFEHHEFRRLLVNAVYWAIERSESRENTK